MCVYRYVSILFVEINTEVINLLFFIFLTPLIEINTEVINLLFFIFKRPFSIAVEEHLNYRKSETQPRTF